MVRVRALLFMGIFLIPIYLFSKISITGRVTDNYGNPLSLVNVYARGYLEEGTITDDTGGFILQFQADEYDTSSLLTLVASHVGYKEKEVEINILPSNQSLGPVTIELEPLVLKEVIVWAQQNQINILSILDSVRTNFSKNYPNDTSKQEMNISHGATLEKDTILFFKGLYGISFEKFSSLNKDSYYGIKTIVEEKFIKKNSGSILPYDMPLLLISYFPFFNLPELSFIQDYKFYKYHMDEGHDMYQISFIPNKDKPFLYEGQMTVMKKDFAITHLQIKLRSSKKNVSGVISTVPGIPGYRFDFESGNVSLTFKNSSKKYYPDTLNGSYVITQRKPKKRFGVYRTHTNIIFGRLFQDEDTYDDIYYKVRIPRK